MGKAQPLVRSCKAPLDTNLRTSLFDIVRCVGRLHEVSETTQSRQGHKWQTAFTGLSTRKIVENVLGNSKKQRAENNTTTTTAATTTTKKTCIFPRGYVLYMPSRTNRHWSESACLSGPDRSTGLAESCSCKQGLSP